MTGRVGALVLLAAASGACVPALREPPSIGELAGGGERRPVEVDRLLADAAEQFARRTPKTVRRASNLWLDAAAADPSRLDGFVGAARSRVWLGVREDTASERLAAARSAVQAAQLCLARAPDDPECSYWLAVSLGVQARERPTTAHDALPRIIALLDDVAAREPLLDSGGPHRVLALLFLRAPGWPTGPGDAELALAHARSAVAVAPDYPPNLTALAEALAARGERRGSREQYERAATLAREWIDRDPDAREWLDEAEGRLRR